MRVSNERGEQLCRARARVSSAFHLNHRCFADDSRMQTASCTRASGKRGDERSTRSTRRPSLRVTDRSAKMPDAFMAYRFFIVSIHTHPAARSKWCCGGSAAVGEDRRERMRRLLALHGVQMSKHAQEESAQRERAAFDVDRREGWRDRVHARCWMPSLRCVVEAARLTMPMVTALSRGPRAALEPMRRIRRRAAASDALYDMGTRLLARGAACQASSS
jgi:hypothetical protein